MATFAALQDPSTVPSSGAAYRLAQAQAANAAYMQGTAPVLPKMGTPPPSADTTIRVYDTTGLSDPANQQGGALDLTPQQYYERYGMTDAQSEALKYQRLNDPATYYNMNMQSMQGMSLSQIASKYGPGAADYVQEYYTRHPTAAFQNITAQYQQQQNRVVGTSGTMYQGKPAETNPYPEDSAAGIAWLVGRQGGAVDITVAQKAVAQGMNPADIIVPTTQYIERPTLPAVTYTGMKGTTISAPEVRWEEPVRRNVTLAEAIANPTIQIASGINIAPYRTRSESNLPQTARDSELGMLTGGKTVAGTSALVDVTGPESVNVYMPFGEYKQTEVRDAKILMSRETGELGVYQKNKYGVWALVGGGSRYSLQSGMFSIGKAYTPAVYTQESAGERFAASADPTAALAMLASPESYSRLGAEGYAGFVRPLDNRKLPSNAAVSRYGNPENLANYVNQVAGGKAEAPGADIPWTVSPKTGAVGYMGPSGETGEYLDLVKMGIVREQKTASGAAPAPSTQQQQIGGSTLTFTPVGTFGKQYDRMETVTRPSDITLAVQNIGFGAGDLLVAAARPIPGVGLALQTAQSTGLIPSTPLGATPVGGVARDITEFYFPGANITTIYGAPVEKTISRSQLPKTGGADWTPKFIDTQTGKPSDVLTERKTEYYTDKWGGVHSVTTTTTTDIGKVDLRYTPIIAQGVTERESGDVYVSRELGLAKIAEGITPESVRANAPLIITAKAVTDPFIAGGMAKEAVLMYGPWGKSYSAEIAGEIRGPLERPVSTAVVNVGMAAGFGGFSRLADYGISRAEAEAAKRGGEGAYGFLARNLPRAKTAMDVGLGGMYAFGTVGNMTRGFTDFSAEGTAYRFGEWKSTEAVPMIIGGAAGYKAPEILGTAITGTRFGVSYAKDFLTQSASKAYSRTGEAIWSMRQRAAGFERGDFGAGPIFTDRTPPGSGTPMLAAPTPLLPAAGEAFAVTPEGARITIDIFEPATGVRPARPAYTPQLAMRQEVPLLEAGIEPTRPWYSGASRGADGGLVTPRASRLSPEAESAIVRMPQETYVNWIRENPDKVVRGVDPYALITARGPARLDQIYGTGYQYFAAGKPAGGYNADSYSAAVGSLAGSGGFAGGVQWKSTKFGGLGDYWTQVSFSEGAAKIPYTGNKMYLTFRDLSGITRNSMGRFTSDLTAGKFRGSYKMPTDVTDAAGRFENIVVYEKSPADMRIALESAKKTFGADAFTVSYGRDVPGGKSSNEILAIEIGNVLAAKQKPVIRAGPIEISGYLEPTKQFSLVGESFTVPTGRVQYKSPLTQPQRQYALPPGQEFALVDSTSVAYMEKYNYSSVEPEKFTFWDSMGRYEQAKKHEIMFSDIDVAHGLSGKQYQKPVALLPEPGKTATLWNVPVDIETSGMWAQAARLPVDERIALISGEVGKPSGITRSQWETYAKETGTGMSLPEYRAMQITKLFAGDIFEVGAIISAKGGTEGAILGFAKGFAPTTPKQIPSVQLWPARRSSYDVAQKLPGFVKEDFGTVEYHHHIVRGVKGFVWEGTVVSPLAPSGGDITNYVQVVGMAHNPIAHLIGGTVFGRPALLSYKPAELPPGKTTDWLGRSMKLAFNKRIKSPESEYANVPKNAYRFMEFIPEGKSSVKTIQAIALSNDFIAVSKNYPGVDAALKLYDIGGKKATLYAPAKQPEGPKPGKMHKLDLIRPDYNFPSVQRIQLTGGRPTGPRKLVTGAGQRVPGSAIEGDITSGGIFGQTVPGSSRIELPAKPSISYEAPVGQYGQIVPGSSADLKAIAQVGGILPGKMHMLDVTGREASVKFGLEGGAKWDTSKTGIPLFDSVIGKHGTKTWLEKEAPVARLKAMTPDEYINLQEQIFTGRYYEAIGRFEGQRRANYIENVGKIMSVTGKTTPGEAMFAGGISREGVSELAVAMKSPENTFDALAIERDAYGRLKDYQEGRHRAVAAKELGIKQIPVWEFTDRPVGGKTQVLSMSDAAARNTAMQRLKASSDLAGVGIAGITKPVKMTQQEAATYITSRYFRTGKQTRGDELYMRPGGGRVGGMAPLSDYIGTAEFGGKLHRVPAKQPVATDADRYANLEYMFGRKPLMIEATKAVVPIGTYRIGATRVTTSSVAFDPFTVTLKQESPAGLTRTQKYTREKMGVYGQEEAWTLSPEGSRTVTRKETVQINLASGKAMIFGEETTVQVPYGGKTPIKRFAGTVDLFEPAPPGVAVPSVEPEAPPISAMERTRLAKGAASIEAYRTTGKYGVVTQTGKMSALSESSGVGYLTPVAEVRRTSAIEDAFATITRTEVPESVKLLAFREPSKVQRKPSNFAVVDRVLAPKVETIEAIPEGKRREYVPPSRPGAGGQILFTPSSAVEREQGSWFADVAKTLGFTGRKGAKYNPAAAMAEAQKAHAATIARNEQRFAAAAEYRKMYPPAMKLPSKEEALVSTVESRAFSEAMLNAALRGKKPSTAVSSVLGEYEVARTGYDFSSLSGVGRMRNLAQKQRAAEELARGGKKFSQSAMVPLQVRRKAYLTEPRLGQRSITDVSAVVRGRKFASDSALPFKSQRVATATAFETAVGFTRGTGTDTMSRVTRTVAPATRTRQDVTVTPDVGFVPRVGTKEELTYKYKPPEVIDDPRKFPGGFGWPGGSTGSQGAGGRGFFAHREVLPLEREFFGSRPAFYNPRPIRKIRKARK